MNIWNIKALIYQLRTKGLFGRILEQENLAVRELLAPVSLNGLCIADIGSGLGNIAGLLENPVPIISIDSSLQMLRKQNSSHIISVRLNASAENLPLKSGSLDFVFVVGLMEYIADKEGVIDELSRVLKPGGRGIITFSPKNNFTFLRWLQGSPVFPTNDEENRNLLHKKFEILDQRKTVMQRQFLVQKK